MNIWPVFDQFIASRCPLCRARDDGLCQRCAAALPRNHHPCRRCALPLPPEAPAAGLCGECQAAPPAFDRAVAPLLYQPPVDDLVARFKYHDRLDLGRLLGDELAGTLQAQSAALLLPVPMDAGGLRRRGFNQAAELAHLLSRRLGIPWSASLLQRARQARHQRGLGRSARQRNLRGAFFLTGRPPARVAIVDDVITTGATAGEIAATLKRGGAGWVEVWAVARTPIGDRRRKP
ncbi:MAG: ComF family protein [Chromatiaceae bacterium]|nr:ComF family protein [Gammaproteobacteria bacterium]MCP5300144.1 ComF family protein [Chromatiaceae bacterium]MCP5422216.1 ComF family protein [Chromatiaceae bacterium]